MIMIWNKDLSLAWFRSKEFAGYEVVKETLSKTGNWSLRLMKKS